jgi:tRNA (cytidine32/uridine32-2'-O)-methyltransferase
MPGNLANIRFVLVSTSHPGNIGAAARAMRAMCLEQLYLIAPKRFPCAEATARAAGADDILHRARMCERLEDALRDCTLVIGTSARRRAISPPCLDPRECGRRAVTVSAQGPVAVVFGREDAGLTNVELDRCQLVVRIPTNERFRSLNVASAAQIIAYEIFCASRTGPSEQQQAAGPEMISVAELEGFYAHLEGTLIEIGFLDPAQPKLVMRRLRRLFARARLNAVEVNILRGILSAVQKIGSARRRP